MKILFDETFRSIFRQKNCLTLLSETRTSNISKLRNLTCSKITIRSKQTFDILIVDFHKQFVVRRMCKLHFSFFVHYICSSLNLISKHDDE